ncbi:MAG: hypothetical protein P4L43_05105 [Syntrophobacteraceae bacterium]|nr:hypothetical protein [Syntrophobacteraceae bacterium]
MDEITSKLQQEAQRIASKHPLPAFYTRFKAPLAVARRLFYNHPGIVRLRGIVEPEYNEALGHGVFHSSRVSIDCAALIQIETDGDHMAPAAVERLMVIGIYSGVLHDICREEKDHALIGAQRAKGLLEGFLLTPEEITCVSEAIRNHEAFASSASSGRQWAQLVSNCLYDADKFRWGADTFTHMLWHMMDYQSLSPLELIEKFPWGMSGAASVIETFRSATGRQFGPEIVEEGLEIGKEIYRYLIEHFRE